jgi:D-2-hydroxyacid dehydrogenase (NADP+)
LDKVWIVDSHHYFAFVHKYILWRIKKWFPWLRYSVERNSKKINQAEESALFEFPAGCKILLYGGCAGEFSKMLINNFPNILFCGYHNEAILTEIISDIQILVGWRFPDELLRKGKNLKWIQLISVNTSVTANENCIPSYLNDSIIITNTKGLYHDSVADYVIWAILTMRRRFHNFLREQSLRKWTEYIGDDISQKTVGILGLGQIGMAVAERAKAFGMKVIGIKRNINPENTLPYVDQVYPIDKLHMFLSKADAVVLCLPLTPETKGLLGIDEMKSMKRDAILVNVSRGGIVKENDLIKVLKDRIVAGAVLDVFETEPLPTNSDFWGLDNVLITPHIAGVTKKSSQKVGQLLVENMRRFVNGKELINVVDREKGY